MRPFPVLFGAVAFALAAAHTLPAAADSPSPYPGMRTVTTELGFDAAWAKLTAAVKTNKMGVVAQASASKGAAGRGVAIAGNAVVMVYRNDFAVRMLEASVPAGIEAPLRFYITEGPDGTASITYRLPSATFASYENAALDQMATELDVIFAKIIADAYGDVAARKQPAPTAARRGVHAGASVLGYLWRANAAFTDPACRGTGVGTSERLGRWCGDRVRQVLRLVVGINDYQHMQDLETAVNDASAVHDLLRREYGFESTLLLNASRYDVIRRLDALRAELTERDNLPRLLRRARRSRPRDRRGLLAAGGCRGG